jgi:hypothetical protein
MEAGKRWHANVNVMTIIACYMTQKEIVSCMRVCKDWCHILNMNKVWWGLYNRTYNTLRVIDQPTWAGYVSDDSCNAKRTLRYLKEAKIGNFLVPEENKYRVWVHGRYLHFATLS